MCNSGKDRQEQFLADDEKLEKIAAVLKNSRHLGRAWADKDRADLLGRQARLFSGMLFSQTRCDLNRGVHRQNVSQKN